MAEMTVRIVVCPLFRERRSEATPVHPRMRGNTVAFASGGRTKYNRQCVGLSKTHWSDAACVGEHGDRACVRAGLRPLVITSTGRGRRQVVKPNRYGFPRTAAGRCKRIAGYQTGDRVRLHQTTAGTGANTPGRSPAFALTGEWTFAPRAARSPPRRRIACS